MNFVLNDFVLGCHHHAKLFGHKLSSCLYTLPGRFQVRVEYYCFILSIVCKVCESESSNSHFDK